MKNTTCPNCGFTLAGLPFCMACGKTLACQPCEFDAASVPAEDEDAELFAELGVGD